MIAFFAASPAPSGSPWRAGDWLVEFGPALPASGPAIARAGGVGERVLHGDLAEAAATLTPHKELR